VRNRIHIQNEMVRSARKIRDIRNGRKDSAIPGVDGSRVIEPNGRGKTRVSGGWSE
jgi:hypothetical protein